MIFVYLPIVNCYGVVVPVEAVDEGLDARFDQVAQHTRRLAGLLHEQDG